MFQFHKDKEKYFLFQYNTAKEYIIPFLTESGVDCVGKKVLEIGCAEAGVLKAFLELDCQCTGIELSASRVKNASRFLSEYVKKNRLELISQNIYDLDIHAPHAGAFDIILLKDVIEHIPGPSKLLKRIREFLKPGGVVFIAFPPWWMPFGGHQQICSSQLLRILPYFHLLPGRFYNMILTMAGEPEVTIRELLDLRETGLIIENFEKILNQAGYYVAQRKLYLSNPIYKYKFGLHPKRLIWGFGKIPYIRNFYTTCAYYVIKHGQKL